MERKVAWNKPVPRTVGKSQIVCKGEFVHASKCGRYTITKEVTSGARRGFNGVRYVFTLVATGKKTYCDSLEEAKDEAEFDNDPAWEPC